MRGYIIECKWCAAFFALCKRCYRGQKYCSTRCRSEGYADIRKRANVRYGKKRRTKLLHAARTGRYRAHMAAIKAESIGIALPTEKRVTDQTSNRAVQLVTPTLPKQFHTNVDPHLDLSRWHRPRKCIICGARLMNL